MSKEWTLSDILYMSGMYKEACTLQAAVVLDVFTVLETLLEGQQQVTVADLAKAVECDERAFAMLVTALASLGLFDREGDTLTLPDSARKFLSRRSSEYAGHIIQHHYHITPGWTRLPEAVKTGRRTRENSSIFTESETEREAFLMGMFNVAVNQAETIAKAMPLHDKKRLLDLGGGPGTYAVFFCKEHAHLTSTIFDLPTSEKFALGVVERFGLSDRVDFCGGNFLSDELPTGYDVVWLSQVLHGESPENAALLVDRAAKTLTGGGIVAVQEFFVGDTRKGPAPSALFGLNMLVGTADGQAYTWGEVASMLMDAGATTIERLDIALPGGCGILVGKFS